MLAGPYALAGLVGTGADSLIMVTSPSISTLSMYFDTSRLLLYASDMYPVIIWVLYSGGLIEDPRHISASRNASIICLLVSLGSTSNAEQVTFNAAT
ncbi:hypothetical protein LPJ79_003917 [Coemansia sp. RSA 1821]|nr:hypothetical protein LPJ79_003917 [Coemansia sp. RSA 1821]KAJ2673355.1 hypothetical protein IWW42_002365 [Coemansia sp. RSA 1085]